MRRAGLPLNQVLVGDCVRTMNTLPARSVDLVFADPPYNLQLDGELWRPDMTKVDAADDDWDSFGDPDLDPSVSFAYYDAFTRAWLTSARRVMKDTATLWVIGSYHNIYRIGHMMLDMGFWILNDVVWIKNNPTPQMRGVRMCNAHEILLWVKKSKEQSGYTFNYKAGKAGNDDRQVRSDWYIPICNGAERLTVNGAKAHATQKPEALLHRVISLTSKPGDVVLDPFCGTGTTAAVARRLGRQFITIDQDPVYAELARTRIGAETPAVIDVNDVMIDAPRPKVPFMSLVERGLLPPGSELRLIGKQPVTARVNTDGTVTSNGYRGSIHKVAALTLGLPNCNGWTHWQFTDPSTGEVDLIDKLRDTALSNGK